ncbi:MAG: mycoredoxin [Anaerolineales bacterium]
MSENSDLYNSKPGQIVMYSASWCPDCRRAKKFLDEQHVAYLNVEIGKDPQAFAFLEKLTRRVRVPTIFFPDGVMLIEPANEELARKLGVSA